MVVIVFEIRFCAVEIGTKTYVPIFKFVADLNRKFIWESIFCLVTIIWYFFDKCQCAFYLCVKSIRYV